MFIKRWTSSVNKYKENNNKHKIIKLNIKKGDENMGTMIKPINAMVEVTETKYINQICESLIKKPSIKVQERNSKALNLLRRARRG